MSLFLMYLKSRLNEHTVTVFKDIFTICCLGSSMDDNCQFSGKLKFHKNQQINNKKLTDNLFSQSLINRIQI